MATQTTVNRGWARLTNTYWWLKTQSTVYAHVWLILVLKIIRPIQNSVVIANIWWQHKPAPAQLLRSTQPRMLHYTTGFHSFKPNTLIVFALWNNWRDLENVKGWPGKAGIIQEPPKKKKNNPVIPHDQKSPSSTSAILNDHLSRILIRLEMLVLRQLRNVPKAAQSAAKCCLYWFVASSFVRQVICEEEEKEEGAQWGLKKTKVWRQEGSGTASRTSNKTNAPKLL